MSLPRQRNQQPLPAFPVRDVLLVFLGGTLGTATRAVASDVAGSNLLASATFTINLLGAFALGLLLGSQLNQVDGSRRRQGSRLLFGTGFLGGFTTYSMLAVLISILTLDGHPWLGLSYGLLTIVTGVLATGLGIWMHGLGHRPEPGTSAVPGDGSM